MRVLGGGSPSETEPLLPHAVNSNDDDGGLLIINGSYCRSRHSSLARDVSHSARGSHSSENEEGSNSSFEKSGGSIRLKNQLGLVDGVGILIGCVIGSGIFISPTGVIRYAGSVGASLLIWVLSGVFSTIGALCYAELGTMIPKSGGDYAYLSEIFGPLPGFMYIWVALIVIMPTGNSIIALTFANYLLQPFFSYCDTPPDIAIRIVAALVIGLLTYINCASVKMVAKIQDFFTVAKVFALTVIIGAGGYHLGTGHTENYQHPFDNTNLQIGSISIAFYQGLFSYAGWNCLNFVVEELKDPYKNLPRAILISMPIVNIVYFLTNVAYFAVLSPDEVLSSYAVAVTFGNRMLGVMAWVIPLFVACSSFGCLNGGIFQCSRLFFVGARQGQLHESLALLNVDSVTPIPSLIFLGILSLAMLVSSDILMLINYATFVESLFALMTITALLTERYRHPNRHRPIKVWIGFPILFFVICFFLVVLPVIEQPFVIGIASGFILSSVPVYYIFVKGETKSERMLAIKASIMSTIQLLTKSLPQHKEI